MSITLAVGGTTVNLPADLYWSDEFSWNPVEQNIERTITGALIISTAQRIAGRPITLEPEDESSSWMPRADCEQLAIWASTPGQTMTLTIRGGVRSVVWRHQDAPVIDGKPLVHFDDVQSTDYYVMSLRLMEI